MSNPKRVFRTAPLTPEEAAQQRLARQQAEADFPPDPERPQPASSGIGAQVRAAREARQLTWYSLATLANIPDPAVIRDIEYGRDAQLSHVKAVAAALGLSLELVEQTRG